jgi:hypothetical protein
MKTAILVHGYHLQAIGWQRVVWGNPKKGVLGRVPKAIVEALKNDASLIVFSTGASVRDGLKEGAYTYRYTLEHLDELVAVTEEWLAPRFLRSFLEDQHELELTSTNTKTEVIASGRLALKHHTKRLVLVSSPNHVQRCLKEAFLAYSADAQLRPLRDNLYATASDEPIGTYASELVIMEPSHRGDQPLWNTWKYGQAFFQVMRQGHEAYEAFLADVGRGLGEHGVDVTWKPCEE